MKRILFVIALCSVAGFSLAQKKAVKDAKAAMKNIQEARELIKPALTDPETANDPEAWKVAGDIEYKLFDDEREADMKKEIMGGKGADEEKMYTGLYDMYAPYVKTDELGQIPDEKGKIKNKFRKDIAKTLKDAHRFYINGGIFYNDKQDYKKAADFFEKYWELPTLDMYADSKGEFNLQDTTYQTIKYYAVISAIQSKDNPRSIKLLKKLASEPYVNNSTFKESDIYELLASEYQQAGDSAAFVSVLHEGAKKFPANKYFTPNLINEFIKGGKTADAIAYIDQAVANDPQNACDMLGIKGSLYAEKKDYVKAEAEYNKALASNANCERALEGLGVSCILQAQDIKEKAGQISNRRELAELDKQTVDFYQKAVPNLEKLRNILKSKDNTDDHDLRQVLMKLQNVYYNLSLLDIDKNKELEEIEKELNK